MASRKPTSPSESTPFSAAWNYAEAGAEYVKDFWQRSVLYADVRRQRGDQYREHLEEDAPTVLKFEYEQLLCGKDLPRPVNYSLMRIIPPADVKLDENKRPFIIIDPRAGHGPGIGGFKAESEMGAALSAGHPCYFVGFLPDPIPGQTVEDVIRAEAEFVRHVGELHAHSEGKPAVIGNCQAGWQILMTAALWPELFGPIIVAGAPLSYWAGDNPMRYTGGLLGGSWLTAMTSDLGDGRFDGAWLVENFENLDPANTLWNKQYNLFANVDTEGPRYLDFEKYWGGYVFLNDVEMQYIVDELFIGNKLSTARLMTSDGLRIDLRNIRSPILVFCSYGDNITPPGQALGWITDLYRNDDEVLSHDQTIVYATHDSIGHLGIFVSSRVGSKEYREFTSHIDTIDLLPAGIYHASVEDCDEVRAACPVDDPYMLKLRRSSVEEVREIVQPDQESEKRFAAAAKVSEINLALYRNLMQPWVRAFATPYTAYWMQTLHPLRTSYEWWSSNHPFAAWLGEQAEQVRANRAPASADNPFLLWQEQMSGAITRFLNHYRDNRDQGYAAFFDALYGSPWVQALAGRAVQDTSAVRQHPGESPEHKAYVEATLKHLGARMDQGGLAEAAIRSMFYVLKERGEADDRHFHHATQMDQAGWLKGSERVAFRQLLREQALLLHMDENAAIEAIPSLLQNASPVAIKQLAEFLLGLARSSENQLSKAEAKALERIIVILGGVLAQKEQAANVTSTVTENVNKSIPASIPVKTVKARKVSTRAAKKTVANNKQENEKK